MRTLRKRTGLSSIWSLLFIAILAACGSDNSDGKTVAVNLSLIVDGRQVHERSATSRLFAWLERWFPGAAPAWAQSVTQIRRHRNVCSRWTVTALPKPTLVLSRRVAGSYVALRDNPVMTTPAP